MFGISFGKLLVLAVVIIGAWQFFKWLEKRADGGAQKRVRKDEARKPVAYEEKPGEVELEQDPKTGVWRPKQKD
jgi:hypothetical protein